MKKWVAFAILVCLAAGSVAVWLVIQNQNSSPTPRHSSEHQQRPSPQQSYVDSLVEKMSLRDKVASLFIMNIPGTDPVAMSQFMEQYKLGGFIMMGNNIPATDEALRTETAALRGSDAKVPRLVAMDEEGGEVKRLPGDTFDSALVLKSKAISATTQAYRQRSAMLQSVGVTLNFGIIADTTAHKDSFIYDRVLGTTPQAAADRVAAAVRATTGRTLSTIKHFPGHGETVADSHVTIPSITLPYAQWRARDEPPFTAGIQAGADVVMMGHLSYGAVDAKPASLSKKWHDILRKELGFRGVIVTDAMGMLVASKDPAYADPVRDAVMALQAGNTMLLYVTNPATSPDVLIDGIVASVEHGELSERVITQNAKLTLELRSKSASLVR